MHSHIMATLSSHLGQLLRLFEKITGMWLLVLLLLYLERIIININLPFELFWVVGTGSSSLTLLFHGPQHINLMTDLNQFCFHLLQVLLGTGHHIGNLVHGWVSFFIGILDDCVVHAEIIYQVVVITPAVLFRQISWVLWLPHLLLKVKDFLALGSFVSSFKAYGRQ